MAESRGRCDAGPRLELLSRRRRPHDGALRLLQDGRHSGRGRAPPAVSAQCDQPPRATGQPPRGGERSPALTPRTLGGPCDPRHSLVRGVVRSVTSCGAPPDFSFSAFLSLPVAATISPCPVRAAPSSPSSQGISRAPLSVSSWPNRWSSDWSTAPEIPSQVPPSP